MPNLYIIAGANGSGKTTFAKEYLPHYAKCNNFINAGLIALGLSPFDPANVRIRAGRLLLEQINILTEEKTDFAIETTLAGKTYLNLLKRINLVVFSHADLDDQDHNFLLNNAVDDPIILDPQPPISEKFSLQRLAIPFRVQGQFLLNGFKNSGFILCRNALKIFFQNQTMDLDRPHNLFLQLFERFLKRDVIRRFG